MGSDELQLFGEEVIAREGTKDIGCQSIDRQLYLKYREYNLSLGSESRRVLRFRVWPRNVMRGNCRVLDMGLLSIVKVGFIEEVPFPVSE